ncbi:adenylosuccinate synthetase [Kitasatospora sp. NBC_00240]|uniref:adenylosuccinate synthetase n=1 Tax=Kitasatospora sp. NBC_00240 TaxID=2903567 RepID=UPI00225B10BE|nr:adenylosuccinate synthetase [Kitasatospora sp. NBC_00240]MCX5214062.1 adenylosuccinate synthetase [Kitasatospora sp. NBC_00240]
MSHHPSAAHHGPDGPHRAEGPRHLDGRIPTGGQRPAGPAAGPPTGPPAEFAADHQADHVIVCDLGFGDAGKGTVVDRLCRGPVGPGSRPVHAVVRHNGGAQAAHNVVTRDGRHHTFAQFGSGTLAGVPTHLSRFMLVDPLALAAEAGHLAHLGVPDPLALLTVDRRALLTTPYHAAANRIREQRRGEARHGSCGLGIGETARYALLHPEDAPTAADCATPARLLAKLTRLREHLAAELGIDPTDLPAPPPADCLPAFQAFAERVRQTDEAHLTRLLRTGPVVFEGAQGVLLDEWHGFHPYTTWSTTTFANAETLLAESGAPGAALRLGVLRSYTTRHGPGPLPTEDTALEIPEPHNTTGSWQGAFRLGHFDAVAHRYALTAASGADALALTHLDAPARHPGLRLCESYQLDGAVLTDLTTGRRGDLTAQAQLTAALFRARPGRLTDPGPDPDSWAEAIAHTLRTPVLMESYGPTADHKLLRALPTPAATIHSMTTHEAAAKATFGPHSHCHWCGTAYPPGTVAWPRTCTGCAEISYRNPLPVVVTLLPVDLPGGERQLVVIRRTIEPGYGRLAFPGGYIDYGESWQQACVRELREETGIEAEASDIILVSTDSDASGGFLCLFGLLPARDLADLPLSVPTDETEGWELATAGTELAFPFHTRVSNSWFTGEYAHL